MLCVQSVYVSFNKNGITCVLEMMAGFLKKNNKKNIHLHIEG